MVEYFSFLYNLTMKSKNCSLRKKPINPKTPKLATAAVVPKKCFITPKTAIGNMKKVGIIGALMGTPAIIILDEPFANLDPSTQIKLKNLIRDWSQNSDSTFLISSHDLAHTTEVCERIVVINKGELVRDIQTSPETLRDLEQYFANQVSSL